MSKQFREWWIREYADLSCGESQISERPDEGFDVHVIEHAALLAEQERAKGLVEALELIDTGERDSISAPEDPLIKELCERIGYGAVMDSAARQWRKKDPIGAFTSGPCVYTVKEALRKYGADE